MATQAFGSNQEVTPAAAPQAHVGFVAPVRDVTQGIESDLNSLSTSLAKVAKEQNFREMGDFVAKARQDIRNISNPVMRRIRAEEYTQNFLKRFGTEHKDTINLLNAPDIKQRIDFANGEIVSVDEASGARSIQKIDQPGDPHSVLTDHTLQTFATAGEYSPRAAQYFQQVVGVNAGKQVDISGFYNTSSSIADFHTNLERQMARYGAMRQFAAANNIEITDKDRADVGRSIQNNMFAMLNTFMDGSYRKLIVNPNNDISPNELTTMFDMVSKDALDALIKSGATDRFSIDVNDLSNKINTMREHMTKSFDEAAKGDLFKAQLAANKAQAIVSLQNSNFMIDLKRTNPGAWKVLQAAPTLNALSNAAYLTTVFDAAKRPGASPTEKAISETQIDLFSGLFNWGSAKASAAKLELIHVNKRENLIEGLNNIQQIKNNQGSMLFAKEVEAWFDRNWNGIETLKKGNFLTDEQYQHIVAQRDEFKNRVKSATKRSGIPPADIDRDTEEVKTLLDKLLGLGKLGASGIVETGKAVLPNRQPNKPPAAVIPLPPQPGTE